MQEMQRNPEMIRQMMSMQQGGAGGGGGGMGNLLAQNPEMLANMMQVHACVCAWWLSSCSVSLVGQTSCILFTAEVDLVVHFVEELTSLGWSRKLFEGGVFCFRTQ